MKNRCINAILVALAIVFSASIQASAADFYVSGAPETDSVTFASDAKLEFIEGTTNSIVGAINFDPADSRAPVSGRLRVQAATLKTGNSTRDEHMRERHLHTAQYPHIEFVLKSASGLPAQLSSASANSLSISGDFTVHGKTLPITAPATVELLPGTDTLKQAILVTASFEIKLDDYGVPRPKVLMLKLAETIKIRVRFIASTSNPKVTF